MLPAVAGRRPGLAPVVDRLRREQGRIAELVEEPRKAVSGDGADPADVLAEVERLTSGLEDHLAHEEERLIPVLDAPAT
ncbi:hypothetical protein GCM10010420_32960 [Streptomyces glaucosporus]|uniref:Hemerythrin-like domain-containing protein n=2 Tax=Streptomyces glaucosporus TaxID=284044 RepID=A0ABN3IFF2_9ACTN